MAEKGRHPKATAPSASSAQAHLPSPPSTPQQTAADESARIDKLVSLTFDSDPIVRRQAASELGKIDDPRAIFALLEMSSDKDPEVQQSARASLETYAGQENQEAIVNLEKIFENRQEAATPEAIEDTKRKMMPSIEKLFSKHKGGTRSHLMPSIEKLFSFMQHKPPAAQPAVPDAPLEPPLGAESQSPTPVSRSGTEIRPLAPAAQHSDLGRLEVQYAPKSGDPLSELEHIHSKSSSTLDEAEAEVGIPPARLHPDQLRKARPALESESEDGASAPAPSASGAYSASRPASRRSHPSEVALENATNFPLPEYFNKKISPTAAIPTMMQEEPTQAEIAEEEDKRLPHSRLDYYKWAYALAVTPGIKSSELKKEKDRLVKDAKNDIELAFKLAIERARENGIESLGGLKPGMKKLSTFPLQVVEVSSSQVPHGRNKTMPMMRLALSDGKRVVPLYCPLERSDGIKVGDLVSLRDMYVDYFVHSQELVLLLGKNGQLVVTK